jgi:uncharacterized protein involved in exopolysaccharide biosynthesis
MYPSSDVPTVAERLDRLIGVWRRHWLIVALVVGLAAVVAAVVASRTAKQYDATAKVLLNNGDIVGSADPARTWPPSDPERDTNTKIGLIKLGTVADGVKARLRLHMSEKALTNKVNVTPEGTSNIVDVTATDGSRTRAAAIANGFADEYVGFRERVARSALREALTSAQRQLAALSAVDRSSARGLALQSRIRQLEIASATQTAGAQVVVRAPVPESASGPHVVRSGLLGALTGLMLAVVIVAVLEVKDRRSRERDELESAFGVAVFDPSDILDHVGDAPEDGPVLGRDGLRDGAGDGLGDEPRPGARLE